MKNPQPKVLSFVVLLSLALTGLAITSPAAGVQDAVPTLEPAATRLVPTQVPYPTPEPTARPEVSGIARILERGALRVGIKLNEPPMGTLDRQGNIVGYDADIARSLAESWGLSLEFVQVTDQTAFEYLLSGEVDMLIAAMHHRREYEAYADFSQSYFPDGVAVMAAAESDIGAVDQLAGRRVAVVTGSRAREALAARSLEVELSSYDILDDAIAALTTGQADAVVDTLVHLRVAARDLPGTVKVLDELAGSAPLAIALPRYDANLRNALNRTLQALERSGRMEEIHNAWFPNQSYPGMVAWDDGDTRSFAQYPTDMIYAAPAMARFRAGESLRVAGFSETPANEGIERLETFYRELVLAMAGRWDRSVEFLSGSNDNPAAWVADGRADLAIGVEPRWDGADAVDYGQAFLISGNRLVVETSSGFTGFGNLRGQRLAVFGPNVEADENTARELAASVRVNLPNISRYDDAEDAVLAIKRNREDAVFGDSLELGPLVEGDDTLQFTERFYSRRGMAFAVPHGDADFRTLVDFTLQDLVRDGTYDRLYGETLGWAEPLPVEVWPGEGAWLFAPQ